MATQRPKPYTISWPFTPKTAEDIDQSFDILFKQVQLNAPGAGVLPVSLGGTGLGSFVKGDLLYASTASTIAGLNDIATGNVVLSGGVNTAPSYGKVGLTTHVSGILPEANGGTNQSTYAQGDLIYASAANTLAKLAKDTNATRYLSNTGTSNAPAWALVNLTNGVTGTLPATSGGTGHASYAVGDLLYASTTTALSRLADVATGNAVISGGVNTAPSWGKIADAHISDVTEGKITDGTILARVAGTETISGNWTFTNTGNFVSSTAPFWNFRQTGAATDEKVWRLGITGSTYFLSAIDDALAAGNFALQLTRSTTTPQLMTASVALALPNIQNTTLAAGNNNDITLNGDALLLRITTAGATPNVLTGLTGGVAGRILLIVAVSGGQTLDINNQDANSTAANRFICGAGFTLTVNNGGALFIYDGTTSRWRLISQTA